MSWKPTGTFEVPPLQASVPPWPTASKAIEPKAELPKAVAPAWQVDDQKKRQFGIELAKCPESPFQAACQVFPDNAAQALWVMKNWATDPIVMASRQAYIQTVDENENLLDKKAFAAKLLRLAGDQSFEGKDVVALLKLYSEVQGFTGKVNIDASTNFNTNNEMKILFVEPEKQEVKTIKQSAPIEHDEDNLKILNGLKLVG